MDCLFCKISTGELPCYKVYEDNKVLAYLDIHPHAKGHTIVISKKHLASIFDASSGEWNEIMAGVQAAAKRLQDVLKPDGLNIGINNGSAAGQVIPHLHWHIFPRWAGDGGGSVHSIVKNGNADEVKEIAKLF